MSEFGVREVLEMAAYHEVEIDKVLDEKNSSFLKFHPVLGYTLHDYVFRDGMRKTLSQYSYEKRGGHRKMINYADKRCRINTYGDSYTQGAQVSDGETWQEVLAAHFREPIRNFGVGGYGVYQAYLKAMEIEADDELAAENIILNIWDDDYMRNIDAARWNRVAWMCRDIPRGKEDGYPVHGFPWAHIRYNLESGKFEEREGQLKDAGELRKLVGKENYYEFFKDDHVVHLYTLREGGDAPVAELEKMAEAFGMNVDLRNSATRADDARRLHYAYGIKSTKYLVDKFQDWSRRSNRKLMIILSYDVPAVIRYLEDGTRFDQEFVDYLNERGYPYIDFLPKKKEEFADYKLDVEPFLERFYIERAGAQVFGHYNPYGNFWFAHSMRDELVDWLSPKPPAYH
ncbi:MAG: SGNH/GDSL hydrolase family protein [Kiritimatiellaeota bacterium]|nr:SGNH/GDSL hydrolase family protein [Kiritimatiellota bacterium]